MSELTSDEIKTFLEKQYDAWNRHEFVEMVALFDSIAPNGFTIEYVGQPVQEGHAALTAVCEKYGDSCKTELVEITVKGREAATVVRNHFFTKSALKTVVSVETYAFDDGRLRVRYY